MAETLAPLKVALFQIIAASELAWCEGGRLFTIYLGHLRIFETVISSFRMEHLLVVTQATSLARLQRSCYICIASIGGR
jgi:hypothetical protein